MTETGVTGVPSQARTGDAPGSLVGAAVLLRPLAVGDRDRLREIRLTREVSRWWGALEDDFPLSDEPSAVRYAIVVDGQITGMVQYHEETEPMYRHAGIDIFIDPAHQGHGIGQDAVRTVARYLIETLGHHRIVIDPAADNHRAISAYAAVGFRSVGVMRAYERNADGTGWHDGLLMELLACELT